jgi:molybdopterin converting factor small subunit
MRTKEKVTRTRIGAMSIKVLVDYSGVIRSHSGKKQEWIEVEDNATVESLLNILGYRKEHQKFIIATIEGNKAFLDTKLTKDTAITLFLPAGGG